MVDQALIPTHGFEQNRRRRSVPDEDEDEDVALTRVSFNEHCLDEAYDLGIAAGSGGRDIFHQSLLIAAAYVFMTHDRGAPCLLLMTITAHGLVYDDSEETPS